MVNTKTLEEAGKVKDVFHIVLQLDGTFNAYQKGEDALLPAYAKVEDPK